MQGDLTHPKPADPSGASVGAPAGGGVATERLTDSPWFWLTAFAAMALISLLVVQGKFAQRQGRLEQRYQDRLLVQQAREARARQRQTIDRVVQPVEPGYEEETLEPIGPLMSEARAKTSLISLQIAAGVLTLIGLVGLLRAKQRRTNAVEQGRAEVASHVLEKPSHAKPV